MWHDEQYQRCQLPSQAAPLDARGQAVSWDCQLKRMFGPGHSLKHSICHPSITGKGETAASEHQILLQGQKMWPQPFPLNPPATPWFPDSENMSQSVWQTGENLVCCWCTPALILKPGQKLHFLAFWHRLSRWARADLPSAPWSVMSWLLSCTVISVVWTLRLRACRRCIKLPLRDWLP